MAPTVALVLLASGLACLAVAVGALPFVVACATMVDHGATGMHMMPSAAYVHSGVLILALIVGTVLTRRISAQPADPEEGQGIDTRFHAPFISNFGMNSLTSLPPLS